MRVLKGDMLVQNMGLRLGEIFRVGTGKNSFLLRYMGKEVHTFYDENTKSEVSKVYDNLAPVSSTGDFVVS